MNESRAARYQRLRRRAEGVSAAAAAALLVVSAFTPLGGALAAWARRAAAVAPAPMRSSVEVGLFVAALAAALEAVALPAVIYLGARLDRRFKRGEHSVSSLVTAQLYSAAVGVAAAVIVALVIHVAARLTGAWWWLATGIALAMLAAAAVRGLSTLIARSGEAAPLSRPDLAARLAQVTADAGVTVAGVFEWRAAESAAHTASVTGIGNGRRVLLAPHVVSDWSDDEVAVVVAHELSHHKHRDLLQALALDVLLLSSALAGAAAVLTEAGQSPERLESLPLTAVVAGAIWLAATPARHALSRWQERRADQFALAATGHADAFAAAVRRLGEQHLVDDRPSPLIRWFFHRHPTIQERLAMAQRLRKA